MDVRFTSRNRKIIAVALGVVLLLLTFAVWYAVDGHDPYQIGEAAPAVVHEAGHDHDNLQHGSEVYSGAGDVGRLKDFGGDDRLCTTVDNSHNGKDAYAMCYRVENNVIVKKGYVLDPNGPGAGVGANELIFSANRHIQWNGRDLSGQSFIANHAGF